MNFQEIKRTSPLRRPTPGTRPQGEIKSGMKLQEQIKTIKNGKVLSRFQLNSYSFRLLKDISTLSLHLFMAVLNHLIQLYKWLPLLSDSVSSGDFSEKATQSWSKALNADKKNDNYHGNHNLICPLRVMLIVSTNSYIKALNFKT